MDKKALRKEIFALRDTQEKEIIEEKSAAIHQKLFQLEEFKKANTILIYAAMRGEVLTKGIFTEAYKRGKKVLVPISQLEDRSLLLSEIHDYDNELVVATFNVPEPKKECLRPTAHSEVDLVIVPGVAFDTQGNRLGYGGGFYDRFLAGLKPDVPAIAICYELQLRDDLVAEEHDLPMDWVITEKQAIKTLGRK
ncbi:MAG: 5-formyltetrahydrofolate cyclo-ligase [bacterium]